MASRPARVALRAEPAIVRQVSERRLVGRPADTRAESEVGVHAVGGPYTLYVGFNAVRECLARAEAGLPRGRQTSDATRRAALGVACAVAEAALAAELPARRPLWAVEVPEDVHDLVDRTGLPTRDVRAGLALLSDAGAVERVVARGENRLRMAEDVVAPAPVLARVAWAPLRNALRTTDTSVAPALAVARAVAVRTAGVQADGGGDPVALTQQELVATTLFGRTAVVAALRGLEAVGALTLEARRGTWTECQLLPPLFAGAGYHTRAPGQGAPSVGPMGESTAESWHPVTLPPARVPNAGTPPGTGPAERPAGNAAPPPAPVGTAFAAAANLLLEVGGVLVPLAPGMSVQPPPGARLVVEVDPDGRRYLRIDAAIRVGPLP